ncbi:cohesin domain-containing protein [Neobacillus sp. PS3-34]|uniref:cohesin domain-containing protein n=1 Tax=Neobacillus sp. PS3-34 TaxID=3070678 RepID=UPI0027DFB690|nr:cohesin domain-containing protein [Neobacillus sp. PS3-34]WML46691.1 cohesin domain-containing protein [Neobacillus sp. PS3-34]
MFTLDKTKHFYSLSRTRQPQPGDIIEIKAFISHAAYTYGLQSIINYDPSVLQLVGKDGTPVTSGNAGDYFATDLAPIDTIKNNAGANTIEYTASFVGDVTKDPKDEGTVVTYYFKWINDKAISTTLTPSLKTVDIYGTLYQSKVESLELKIK